MLTTGGQRPRGMSPFSNRVYDVLEIYTVSPWNVLKVVCGWRGVDPLDLQPDALGPLIPELGAHVARMTDDENGRGAMDKLQALLRARAALRG
ncbi:MAG TPA: hypothetical protein VGO62_11540 [Myxococcota bacterium]|jgi:hypothetical protein